MQERWQDVGFCRVLPQAEVPRRDFLILNTLLINPGAASPGLGGEVFHGHTEISSLTASVSRGGC